MGGAMSILTENIPTDYKPGKKRPVLLRLK